MSGRTRLAGGPPSTSPVGACASELVSGVVSASRPVEDEEVRKVVAGHGGEVEALNQSRSSLIITHHKLDTQGHISTLCSQSVNSELCMFTLIC